MEYNIISFGISNEKDIDFLIKQHSLFKKYCLDDFKFTVMICREQGSTINNYDNLIKKLKEFNIFDYVFIPDCLKYDVIIRRNISEFVGYALNESIQKIEKGKLFFIHLDLLPINNFSLKDIFKNCKIGGMEQIRGEINYLWDNLLYIDTNHVDTNKISFKCCTINNQRCDTGGESFFYLKTLSEEEKIFFKSVKHLNNEETINNLKTSNENINCLLNNYNIQKEESNPHWSEIYIDDIFFHYRSFSRWHQDKSNIENDKINKKRKESILKIN